MNTLVTFTLYICSILHLFTIIIDQTTLRMISLIICQLTQSYIELLQQSPSTVYPFDHVLLFLNRPCGFQEEQVITIPERKVLQPGSGMEAYPSWIRLERYSGCILIGNVCPAAKYLSGRMQPALAEPSPGFTAKMVLLRCCWSYLHPISLVDGFNNRFQFLNSSAGQLPA